MGSVKGIFDKSSITEAAINMNEIQLVELVENLLIIFILVLSLESQEEEPLKGPIIVERNERDTILAERALFRCHFVPKIVIPSHAAFGGRVLTISARKKLIPFSWY